MKSSKRILLFKLASSAPGGVNTRFLAMDTYLKRHYEVGHLNLSPVRPIDTLLHPLQFLRTARKLVLTLRSYDIVISFSLIPNLVSSLLSRRSVLSLTGSPYYNLDSSLFARLYWSFLLQPLSCILATAIVPTSPSVFPPYLLSLPFLKKKTHPLYGFLDYMRIDTWSSSTSIHQPNPQPKYFLFMGSLTHQKGILELIPVFATFKKTSPLSTIQLWVCGDGPLLQALLSTCREYSLGVAFFSEGSPPPNSDVILELNTHDPYQRIAESLGVVCPFYFEGLSNTILESLYLNKPVLASLSSSSLFLQETLAAHISADDLFATSLLRLLPHPSSYNILEWATALQEFCVDSFNPVETPITFLSQFSASANTLKWQNLLDSIA